MRTIARNHHLNIVGAIGRSIDRTVCAGSIANAARSVSLDQERADQRRDAWLAVAEVEQQAQPARVRGPRRTG